MNFRVLEQRGLENARSPFRVVEDSGQEVEWVNRFLDQERVRSVAETTLRSYAYDLLNFLRWWVEVSQTTAACASSAFAALAVRCRATGPILRGIGGEEEIRTPMPLRCAGFRDQWATIRPSPPLGAPGETRTR